MKFQGKYAVVTGGMGALGRVIVKAFLEEGAQVAVPVRGTQASAAPSTVFSFEADLSVEAEVASFMQAVRDRFGALHFLVNAAGGYAGGKAVSDVSVAEWDQMMQSNLRSAFLMGRAVVPLMREAGEGRIINISAMPALLPSTRKAPYAIAKRGVNALTEIMADELKGERITVNAIAPSIILTDANVSSMPGAETSRWVTPEEISSLILYLCGGDARSISGNIIRIFGGV